jgi:ADP-dependent phosphofructokinase/glucokinase
MKTIIAPEDRKFVIVDNVDPYFSPTRNNKTVEDVIKKTEIIRARRIKDYQNEIAERSNVVASYLMSRAVDSGKPIERYVSRKELARLQGRKIIEKLAKGYRILDSADNYAS